MDTEQTNEELESAAFASAFDGATEQAAPEPAENSVAPEQPTEVEPSQPEEKQAVTGMTESQIKDLLAEVGALKKELENTRGKVFGKFGEVQRTILEMQKQKPAEQAGDAPKLSKESLKKLSAEYPDIAEALAEDLSAIDLRGGNEKPNEIVEGLRQEFQVKLLDLHRPKWRETISSDEFRRWEASLPPDEREKIATTWDAVELAGALDRFKEFADKAREENGKREREEKARQDEERSKAEKQKRLESVIRPKGVTSTDRDLTEEEAFNAVFR